AAAMPQSTFVGVDLSGRQVAEGHELIQSVGLQNIELRHQSLTEIGPTDGLFDYIICHGVYSWVPSQVQDAILRISAENLSRHGVAYISYNTNPGWFMRGMVRQMMCFHARQFDDAETQVAQARALLDFLIESGPATDPTYHELLKREAELIRPRADSYLFHEHLEANNEPLFFHEFAERAGQHGLRYLCETQLSEMIPANYGEKVDETLQQLGSSLIHVEQYLDFVRNRTFRRTLLCHGDLQPVRELSEQQLADMHIVSSLQPASSSFNVTLPAAEEFRGQAGVTATVTQPILKAALLELYDVSPAAIPFANLAKVASRRLAAAEGMDAFAVRNSDRVAEDQMSITQLMLELYSRDLVSLRAGSPRFTLDIEPRPFANALIRHQATVQKWATNLQHDVVSLNDLDCQLLRRLDGTHDVDGLAEEFGQLILAGDLVVEHDGGDARTLAQNGELLRQLVEHGLRRLSRMCLLQPAQDRSDAGNPESAELS
ncbi:MAG: class I SAM-dependent methyltransferase, partial [Planctomycetaceae bacterium]|nr:class I SAM-dependent methyltransferase [Planctomycetaceae bacterium]